MSEKAAALKDGFETLNNNLIAFVDGCSQEEWKTACPGETWPVGVVARHVAEGHYSLLGFIQLIVAGQELPEMSMDAIDAMNEKHAAEHADCTREETLDALRSNGAELAGFVAGLSDADLACKGSMPAFGGEFSVDQMIEFVIFQSAQEHLDNIKKAVGK